MGWIEEQQQKAIDEYKAAHPPPPVTDPRTGEVVPYGDPRYLLLIGSGDAANSVVGGQFGYTPLGVTNRMDATNIADQQAISNAYNTQQTNLRNAAALTQQGGAQALNNAYTTAAQQQNQGQAGLYAAQQLADYNNQLGQQALTGMSALSAQANQASANYGGQGNQLLGQQQAITAAGLSQLPAFQQQTQGAIDALNANAAGNIANGGFYGQQGVMQAANQMGDRANTLGALQRLQNYYQQGPGPSAAQAQLQESTGQNMANAISLAHSGRGMGDTAANMRAAMFANSATQQQAISQMAQLRAQEDAAWRGQQLQAMGTEQNALSGLSGQDLSAMQASGNLGLGYNQLGQSGVQTAANLGIQGNAAVQNAYQNYGQQALAGSQAAGQLGANYAGLGQTYLQSGMNAQQGYNQQANTAFAQGQGYNQAMQGLANQSTGAGLSAYDSLTAQGNNLTSQGANLGVQGAQQNVALDQSNLANQNNLFSTQLASDTSRYGANLGVSVANANASAQQSAAIVGGIGAAAGGIVGSFAGPGGTAGGAVAGGALGSAVGKAAGSDYRMKDHITPEPDLARRMHSITKFMNRKVA